MNKPPVIFLAFANYYEDPNKYLRNLPLEQQRVRDALETARRDGLCEVVERSGATIEDIIRVFQDKDLKGRIAVFHYGGHASSYALQVETPFREKALLYAEGFAAFLGEQPGLQLVFLNGCATAGQAAGLQENGVPAVIVTQSQIEDAAACELSVLFYRAMGAGATLRSAFTEAEAGVRMQLSNQLWRTLASRKGKADADMPWQFICRPGDKESGRWNLPDAVSRPLYTLPKLPAGPLPSAPFPGRRSYRPEEAAVFHGRDYEIRDLFQLITAEHAPAITLLYGAAGVGKSSLLQAGLLPRLRQQADVLPAASSGDELLEGTASPRYIFLDPIGSPTSSQLEELAALTGRRVRFVMSMRSSGLPAWEQVLQEKNLPFQTFFLPPVSGEGIRQAVLTPIADENAARQYQAVVEPDLPEKLSALLSQDQVSPRTPILQLVLADLWETARRASPQQPALSWALYQKRVSEGCWQHYLEEQLRRIDEPAYSTGLSYNLLQDMIEASNRGQAISANIIYERYPGGKDHLSPLLEAMRDAYILTEISDPAPGKEAGFRLAHQLFLVPLLGLINHSNRPGQRLRRLLHQQTTEDIPLTEPQLQLLDQYRHILPQPTAAGQALINRSQALLRQRKSRRRAVFVLRLLALLTILSFGVYLNNPYLLLLIILLLVLYE